MIPISYNYLYAFFQNLPGVWLEMTREDAELIDLRPRELSVIKTTSENRRACDSRVTQRTPSSTKSSADANSVSV